MNHPPSFAVHLCQNMNRRGGLNIKSLCLGAVVLLSPWCSPRMAAGEASLSVELPAALQAEVDTNDEWAIISALMRSQPAGLVGKKTEDYMVWREYTLRLVSDLGWVFFDQHPNDPRRWEWAEFMTNGQHIPGYSNDGNSRWFNRLNQLKETCISSQAAPVVLRCKLRCEAVDLALAESRRGGAKASRADWLKLGKEVIAIANDAPDDEEVLTPLKNVANGVLRGANQYLGANNAVQEAFEASPNQVLKQLAGRKDAIASAMTTPMTMRFMALDGREVDLSKMRNKVVLIDFRGVTWCGSCREEEPFIRKAYDQYHRQGLEVICITWEMKENSRDLWRSILPGRACLGLTISTGNGRIPLSSSLALPKSLNNS